jgi:hypothetical protein
MEDRFIHSGFTCHVCNTLETNEINAEENRGVSDRKVLTEKDFRIIVRKVPRGLRNSKPPKT